MDDASPGVVPGASDGDEAGGGGTMAAKTITISKGNQYDRDGFFLEIEGSTLHAWGGIGRRMDGATGLTWDGTYLPSGSDREAVEAAIRDVMADGEERVVQLGQDDAVEAESREWRSPRGLSLTEEMDREDSAY